MARVSLPYGFGRTTDSPVDTDYLKGSVPYTGTTEANIAINIGIRYRGLTVNINGEEYWYKNGVNDNDLVLKKAGSTDGLTPEFIATLPLIDTESALASSGLEDYAPYRTSEGYIMYKYPTLSGSTVGSFDYPLNFTLTS